MDTLAYFRGALKEEHKSLLDAVTGLTDAQLHFRPLGKGNSIAFILWHYARTEDIMANVFLQKKKTVWNMEGWDEKFGMDPRSQGTGMTAEQAATIRIRDLGEFLKYVERVFQASDAYLETLEEGALDEVRESPAIGKRSIRQILGGIILHHAVSHRGEIWYAKGLQGLQGSPI